MLLNLPSWAFWLLMVAFLVGSVQLANWLERQERLDTRRELARHESRPEGIVIQAAHRFRAHRDEQRQLTVFGTVRSTPDVLLVPGHAWRDA